VTDAVGRILAERRIKFDRAALAHAIEWAGNFYAWTRDAPPPTDPLVNVKQLRAALSRVRELTAFPIDLGPIIEAMVDVERFAFDGAVGHPREEWLDAAAAARARVDAAIRTLLEIELAARQVAPPPGKSGSKRARLELIGAVRTLADHWTKALGQRKFAVTFYTTEAGSERRKLGAGKRYVSPSGADRLPKSVPALFVCAAMREIDPTVGAREIEAAMQVVRKEITGSPTRPTPIP